MPTYLQSLRLQNLLSFGPDAEAISFGPLSVLIGPNGSGKSNLIEAIGLLASAPRSLSEGIREGGGIGEWLWKGFDYKPHAHLAAVFSLGDKISYTLSLEQYIQQFQVADERIEGSRPPFDLNTNAHLYFGYIKNRPNIRMQGGDLHEISRKDFKSSESILSQREDPDIYPQMSLLSAFLKDTKIYRNWNFGRHTRRGYHNPLICPTISSWRTQGTWV